MKPARWIVPSPADALFGIVLFAATVVRGYQAINTDGDFARHVRVGHELLAHGFFFRDRFSWTMQGRPFVPYEWLSEVAYAGAHQAAGIPGAVVLMGVACATAYALAYLFLVRRGVDPLLAFVAASAAAVAGSYHWLARPHVFSLVGVVLVLWLLESALDLPQSDAPDEAAAVTGTGRRLVRRLLIFAAFFCVWANLHAAFLIGLALIACYGLGALLDVIVRAPGASSRTVLGLGAVFVAALAGVSINPSGPHVISHLLAYFRMPWLVDATMEMRSPDFHTWYGRTFLLLLCLAMAVMGLARTRFRGTHLMLLLGATALALQSARNIEIWALSGLLIVTLYADKLWRELAWRPLLRLRRAFDAAAATIIPGPWSALMAAAAMMVAVRGGRVGGLQVLPRGFDRQTFPVQVVNRARQAGVTGRMLNELAWGGYMLYAWPEEKVFIDGQTDFYGDSLSQLYMSLRLAKPEWRRRLDSLRVSLVLMPDNAPLVWLLEDTEEWNVADSADGAVLLRRDARGTDSSGLTPPGALSR